MLLRMKNVIGVAVGVAMMLASAQGQAADKVSIRLSYTPFAAHIPVYVAQAKGYYSDAGIEVNILPGRGSTFAAMTVGAGKEEFGIADSGCGSGSARQGCADHRRRQSAAGQRLGIDRYREVGDQQGRGSQGPQCRRVPWQHHDDLPAGAAQEARNDARGREVRHLEGGYRSADVARRQDRFRSDGLQ